MEDQATRASPCSPSRHQHYNKVTKQASGRGGNMASCRSNGCMRAAGSSDQLVTAWTNFAWTGNPDGFGKPPLARAYENNRPSKSGLAAILEWRPRMLTLAPDAALGRRLAPAQRQPDGCLPVTDDEQERTQLYQLTGPWRCSRHDWGGGSPTATQSTGCWVDTPPSCFSWPGRVSLDRSPLLRHKVWNCE